MTTVSAIKVRVQRKAIVKLKVLPRFPVNVLADAPVTLDRTGGNYTFGLDVNSLSESLDGLHLDLTAVEALSGTGFAARTAENTWALRSLDDATAGITWTNPAGIAGNPKPVLANDLGAVEGLSGTGLARRTGADAWSVGTTVSVAEGGTGATTLTGILKGNGTGAVTVLTGTDNYLPKWSSNLLTGTSLLFDNGTNVGVGTASPTNKLDVAGTLRATGSATIGNGTSANATLDGGSGSGNGSVLQIIGQGVTHLIGNEAKVFGTGTGSNLDIFAGGTTAIDFYTNSLKRMTVGSDGTITLPYALNISGAPTFTVPIGVNPYFGANSLTSQAIQATAQSATIAETAFQSIINSSVGGGNPAVAFKIAIFGAISSSAGTGDIYGGNFVADLGATVAGSVNALALEADLNVRNAHYGDATGAPTQPYATPFYVAAGGSMRLSAMMMVNTTAPANRGLVFWSGNATPLRLNTIEDWMTSGSFAMIGGTYAGAVIDMSQATITSNIGMKLPNSKFVSWRNGANSADINVIALNSSNQVVFGSGSTGVAMQGTTTNNSAAAGNVGEYVSNLAAPSAVSLTSGAANNVTSISLTAGDWDVSGIVTIQPAGGTTMSQVWTYISITSATLGADALANGATLHTIPFTTGNLQQLATGTVRISLASTATVYLQAYPAFSGGTATGGGGIRARRAR